MSEWMQQLIETPMGIALLIGDLLPWGAIFRIGAIVGLGFPAVFWLSRRAQRYVTVRYESQRGFLAGKVILYSGFILLFVSVLNELDFDLTHVLGAAGIVGIAVGFASQTSVSNIISGLFLLAEKPFGVGDIITVSSVTGQVLSIDTLSVKIRMFDNKFVRIPNETIIKSEVTNITRFPIRRIDLQLGVAYKENIGKVRDVLLDLAEKHPLVLQDPEPLVILTGYGASSIDILFAVWIDRTDFLTVRNAMYETIKERFDAEGIEIPFPHLSLYSGLATEPFPVKVVGEPPKAKPRPRKRAPKSASAESGDSK